MPFLNDLIQYSADSLPFTIGAFTQQTLTHYLRTGPRTTIRSHEQSRNPDISIGASILRCQSS